MGFCGFFRKSRLFMKHVTAKKRIVDPILLHTKVCTKNLGNGYKRSQLAKSQCICPQSFKIVSINTVKKIRLIESTLSHTSLVWIQALEDCSRVRIESPWSIWKSLMLQEGAYTMDQEFDGKGLTPYDPAHNSSFLLAGHNLTRRLFYMLSWRNGDWKT